MPSSASSVSYTREVPRRGYSPAPQRLRSTSPTNPSMPSKRRRASVRIGALRQPPTTAATSPSARTVHVYGATRACSPDSAASGSISSRPIEQAHSVRIDIAPLLAASRRCRRWFICSVEQPWGWSRLPGLFGEAYPSSSHAACSMAVSSGSCIAQSITATRYRKPRCIDR